MIGSKGLLPSSAETRGLGIAERLNRVACQVAVATAEQLNAGTARCKTFWYPHEAEQMPALETPSHQPTFGWTSMRVRESGRRDFTNIGCCILRPRLLNAERPIYRVSRSWVPK